MNLREVEIKKPFPIRQVVTSFTGFFLAVLIFSIQPKKVDRVAELRQLGIEEKEAVLFTLAELQAKHPELAKGFIEAAIVLSQSDQSAVIDPKAKYPLVRLSNDTLIFSPKYFRTDTFTQEDSLADSLSRNEIAVRDR